MGYAGLDEHAGDGEACVGVRADANRRVRECKLGMVQ